MSTHCWLQIKQVICGFNIDLLQILVQQDDLGDWVQLVDVLEHDDLLVVPGQRIPNAVIIHLVIDLVELYLAVVIGHVEAHNILGDVLTLRIEVNHQIGDGLLHLDGLFRPHAPIQDNHELLVIENLLSLYLLIVSQYQLTWQLIHSSLLLNSKLEF